MHVMIRIAAGIEDGARRRHIAVDLNVAFDTRACASPAFAHQPLEIGQ